MNIGIIEKDRLKEALALIRETFSEFVAPYYTEEGVDSFIKYHSDSSNFDEAVFYGAYDEDGELAGVLGATDDLSHIIAFYVKKNFQNKGIGSALFKRFCDDNSNAYVTVNASPYATAIYEKLGFIEAGEMQEIDGRLFTPMMYVFRFGKTQD